MNKHIPAKPSLDDEPVDFSSGFNVVELRAGFEDRGDGEGVEVGPDGSGVGVEVEGRGGMAVPDVGGDEEVEDG